jgi:hypothetical protein
MAGWDMYSLFVGGTLTCSVKQAQNESKQQMTHIKPQPIKISAAILDDPGGRDCLVFE